MQRAQEGHNILQRLKAPEIQLRRPKVQSKLIGNFQDRSNEHNGIYPQICEQMARERQIVRRTEIPPERLHDHSRHIRVLHLEGQCHLLVCPVTSSS